MSVTRRLLTWTGSIAAALAVLLMAGTAMAQQEQERQRQQQQQQQQQQQSQEQGQRNIVDTLREQGNFTKFLELLKKAELEETLTQRGPFTVFAPTDEAFNQVPQQQQQQLMQNDQQLKSLLQRHIVRGEKTAADLARENQISPLEGAAIQVKAGGQQTGQAQRQGQQRDQAQAREQQDREISQADRQRETPVRTGQRLSQIAPDDQIVVMLIPKSDPSNVKSVQLTGEQVREMSNELITKLQQARSLQSEQVDVRDDQNVQIMIGSARVIEPNIRATNGIIHAIDKVLTQENTRSQQ